MVTIASKVPFGLVADVDGVQVHINGSNHPNALLGFGMTPNVDDDWWLKWCDTAKHPAVESGVIFVNDAKKITGEVAEKQDDIKCLEPIDPDKPSEVVRGIEPETTYTN